MFEDRVFESFDNLEQVKNFIAADQNCFWNLSQAEKLHGFDLNHSVKIKQKTKKKVMLHPSISTLDYTVFYI